VAEYAHSQIGRTDVRGAAPRDCHHEGTKHTKREIAWRHRVRERARAAKSSVWPFGPALDRSSRGVSQSVDKVRCLLVAISGAITFR